MTERKNIDINRIEELKKNLISAHEPSIPTLFSSVSFLTELVNHFVQKMIEEKNDDFLELSQNYDSSSYNDYNQMLMLFSEFSYSHISKGAMHNHLKEIYTEYILSDSCFYSRFIYLSEKDAKSYIRFDEYVGKTDDIQRVSSFEVRTILNELEIPIPDIEILKNYLSLKGYDVANEVRNIMRIVNQTYFSRTGKYIIPPISSVDIERVNHLNENARGLNHDESIERFYLNRYYSFCYDEFNA